MDKCLFWLSYAAAFLFISCSTASFTDSNPKIEKQVTSSDASTDPETEKTKKAGEEVLELPENKVEVNSQESSVTVAGAVADVELKTDEGAVEVERSNCPTQRPATIPGVEYPTVEYNGAVFGTDVTYKTKQGVSYDGGTSCWYMARAAESCNKLCAAAGGADVAANQALQDDKTTCENLLKDIQSVGLQYLIDTSSTKNNYADYYYDTRDIKFISLSTLNGLGCYVESSVIASVYTLCQEVDSSTCNGKPAYINSNVPFDPDSFLRDRPCKCKGRY